MDHSISGLEADFRPKGGWLTRRPGFTVSILEGLNHSVVPAASQPMAEAMAELFELTSENKVGFSLGAH